MSITNYSVSGATAVIAFNNPPVNSYGHEMRKAIVANIDQAVADPAGIAGVGGSGVDRFDGFRAHPPGRGWGAAGNGASASGSGTLASGSR